MDLHSIENAWLAADKPVWINFRLARRPEAVPGLRSISPRKSLVVESGLFIHLRRRVHQRFESLGRRTDVKALSCLIYCSFAAHGRAT